jgi:hypothetical protein
VQTPRWLVASVVGIVATTAALSVSWLGICTWVIGPQLWQEYVKTEGMLPAQEPKVCDNADERAIQVLTGLLATLLALMSNPPSAGDR